jgi:hypothetical protein
LLTTINISKLIIIIIIIIIRELWLWTLRTTW